MSQDKEALLKRQKFNQLKSLPLEQKIQMTKMRIRQFYEHFDGDVYVAFSGGKDSTVLLHIVRSIYPEVLAVFNSTGTELPEIMQFVRKMENVKIIRPKMRFDQIVDKYGYPMISKETAQKVSEIRNTKSSKLFNKRMFGDEKGNGKMSEKWKFFVDAPFNITSKCCDILKKNPAKKFEKETGLKPIIGTMAAESALRMQRPQCNIIDGKRPSSAPLQFWTEEDVLEYVDKYEVEICTLYTEHGYKRTGCFTCLFGCQFGDPTYEKMKNTHPNIAKKMDEKYQIEEKLEFMKKGIEKFQCEACGKVIYNHEKTENGCTKCDTKYVRPSLGEMK